MTRHRHIPNKAQSKEVGWTHCVTPDKCAANPRRQAAHGNIVRVDVCYCGAAKRLVEINNSHANYGPWEEN